MWEPRLWWGQGTEALKSILDRGRAGGWAAGRHQKQSGPITAKACNQTCLPASGCRRPDTTVRVCAPELATPTGRNTSISWGWADGAAAPAQQTAEDAADSVLGYVVCVFCGFFFSLFVILVKNSAVPLPSCEWVGASPGPSSYPALDTEPRGSPSWTWWRVPGWWRPWDWSCFYQD